MFAPEGKAIDQIDRMDGTPVQTIPEYSDQTAGTALTNEFDGTVSDGEPVATEIPDAFRKRFIPTIDPRYYGTGCLGLSVSPAREVSEVSKPLPGSTPDLPKAENDTSYRRFLRQNTGYDRHMRDNPDDELYQSFFELLCDVVESKSQAPIYVNKQPFPPEVVRSRLLKITEAHMEYVVNSFRDNPNPDGIHNVRAYMLTMLYNAPVTFKAHICQQVNHDMYGGGWEKKGIAPAEAFSPFQENEGGRAYAG